MEEGSALDGKTREGLIILAFLAGVMLVACAAVTVSLWFLGVGG